jgi:pantetheine-phosphate adenylyltransferase
MNKKLDEEIETIFIMTSSKYSYLSSSVVKEVSRFGGCVASSRSTCSRKAIKRKIQRKAW